MSKPVMNINLNSLLPLLQLVSSTLPVGAYSYSEGLENLIDRGIIRDRETLRDWLGQELRYGSIRWEAAMMLRSHQSFHQQDFATLVAGNYWLSAARETAELRQQSWQMGQSLLNLLVKLESKIQSLTSLFSPACNYAVAFGIAAACWQIEPLVAAIGYLHSWTANLISAGVRLIPLGQTSGQQLLFQLQDTILQIAGEILDLPLEKLESCSWGLSLASIAHETQYTRLFRS